MTRGSDPFHLATAAHAAAADGPATSGLKSEVPGSLTRRLPHSTAADDEPFAMRRTAWREQGIAVLRAGEIRNDWLRQAVVNEATRLYGEREDGVCK